MLSPRAFCLPKHIISLSRVMWSRGHVSVVVAVLFLMLTWSQIRIIHSASSLSSSSSTKSCSGSPSHRYSPSIAVFDGQTESVGRARAVKATPNEDDDSLSDLSQLLASVSLNEFVLILAGTKDHSGGHYGDLNGFLITITRHNKIMQIFTTQTSKWR